MCRFRRTAEKQDGKWFVYFSSSYFQLYEWENNQTVAEWLESQMAKPREASVIQENMHCIKRDAVLGKVRKLLEVRLSLFDRRSTLLVQRGKGRGEFYGRSSAFLRWIQNFMVFLASWKILFCCVQTNVRCARKSFDIDRPVISHLL